MDEHLDEIGFGEEVMDTSTDLVEIASSARVLRFSDAAVVNDTQSSVDTPKEFVPVQEGSHLDNVGLEGTLSDYSASLCSVPAVSQAILVSEAPITAASVGPTAALVAQSVTAPQPTPVEVYVRVRPLNTEERGRGETSTITVLDERTLITTAPQNTTGGPRVQQYTFSRAFGAGTDNERVYKEAAEAGVEDALRKGSSYLLFSYGMTGSGKTHTMTGNSSDAGVLPRTLANVFRFVAGSNEGRGEGDSELVVTLSYLEVHNEKVHDLFAEADGVAGAVAPPPSTRASLDIVQGPGGRIHVQNARQVYVSTPKAAMALFLEAASRRVVAATAMNAHSSRSHALAFFNLYKRTPAAAEAAGRGPGSNSSSSINSQNNPSLLAVVNGRTGAIEQGYTPHSTLVLVDLAGSERLARTGNTGALLEQANSINKSLSHIMRCFTAMVEGGGGNNPAAVSTALRGFPFRESKLTHLLWDRLQGPYAGRVAMVVCCGPGAGDYGETAAALRYGSLVKKIVTITDPSAARAAAATAASHNSVQYDIDGRRKKGGIVAGPASTAAAAASATTTATTSGNSLSATINAATAPISTSTSAATATLTASLAAANKALEEERALRKERESQCSALQETVRKVQSHSTTIAFNLAELNARVESLEEELCTEKRRTLILGEELEEMSLKCESVEEEVREEMAAAAHAQVEEVEATWKAKIGRLREEEMARAERLLRLHSLHSKKLGGKKRGSSMIFGLLKDAGMEVGASSSTTTASSSATISSLHHTTTAASFKEGEDEELEEDQEMEEEEDEEGGDLCVSMKENNSTLDSSTRTSCPTAGMPSSSDARGAVVRQGVSLSSITSGSQDEICELREQLREAEDELERTRERLEKELESVSLKCTGLEGDCAQLESALGEQRGIAKDLGDKLTQAQFLVAEAVENAGEAEKSRKRAEEEAGSAKASVVAFSARCVALEGQLAEERAARLALAGERELELNREVSLEREKGEASLREVTNRLRGELDAALSMAASARGMHDELAGAVDGYKARIMELEKRVELFGNSITTLRSGAVEKDAKIRLLSKELGEALRGGLGVGVGSRTSSSSSSSSGPTPPSTPALEVLLSNSMDDLDRVSREKSEAIAALEKERSLNAEQHATLSSLLSANASLTTQIKELTASLEAAALSAAQSSAMISLPQAPAAPTAARGSKRTRASSNQLQDTITTTTALLPTAENNSLQGTKGRRSKKSASMPGIQVELEEGVWGVGEAGASPILVDRETMANFIGSPGPLLSKQNLSTLGLGAVGGEAGKRGAMRGATAAAKKAADGGGHGMQSPTAGFQGDSENSAPSQAAGGKQVAAVAGKKRGGVRLGMK